MSSKYSNIVAMRALVCASLQSILRSPSAIVFSIAFPLIFILVFGFLNGGGGAITAVAIAPGADTNQALLKVFQQSPALSWTVAKDSAAVAKMLSGGELDATLEVVEKSSGQPLVIIRTSASRLSQLSSLQTILKEALQSQDPEIARRTAALAAFDVRVAQLRDFKTIDFILPGQLGFSLLAAGVFGTAFVFFNLRQTLVLKRFFATPVRREVIVISEGLARVIFQLAGAIIIIGIGHFVFGYTLVHGWVTFLQILLLCAMALMVFMGFGFVISSVAKSESSIPPFSNLITLPQFLLAGTFFSIEVFPKWLQPVCRALPLTYFNHAIRRIAFDGVGFWEVRTDLLVLAGWGVFVYVLAARLFKWE